MDLIKADPLIGKKSYIVLNSSYTEVQHVQSLLNEFYQGKLSVLAEAGASVDFTSAADDTSKILKNLDGFLDVFEDYVRRVSDYLSDGSPKLTFFDLLINPMLLENRIVDDLFKMSRMTQPREFDSVRDISALVFVNYGNSGNPILIYQPLDKNGQGV